MSTAVHNPLLWPWISNARMVSYNSSHSPLEASPTGLSIAHYNAQSKDWTEVERPARGRADKVPNSDWRHARNNGSTDHEWTQLATFFYSEAGELYANVSVKGNNPFYQSPWPIENIEKVLANLGNNSTNQQDDYSLLVLAFILIIIIAGASLRKYYTRSREYALLPMHEP